MTDKRDEWAMPKAVRVVDVAFGGNMKELLPPMSEIPAEFKGGDHPMVEVVDRWFFEGIEGAEMVPREGVKTGEALAHLQAVMGSFEPQHEHKTAACAYLLDRFFEKVEVPE